MRRIFHIGFLVVLGACTVAAYAQAVAADALTVRARYEQENDTFKLVPRPGESDVIHDRIQKLYVRASATVNQIMQSRDPKVAGWWAAVRRAPAGNTRAKLDYVNALTNRTIRYVEDYDHYGKGDYWAIPIETLKGGGDCEDISILKAMALYRTGWPLKDLHILIGYVDYRGRKTPHAVLLASNGNDDYILDNLATQAVRFDDMRILPVYMSGNDGTTVFRRGLAAIR